MLSRLAGKSLLKMIKRWPSMISKCVISLAENLQNPDSPECAVLGSCAVLTSQTILKHLTTVVIQDHMLKIIIRNDFF
jgi:proteasome activator subunit 4